MTKNILIVDDSASLRTVVKLALERAGYAVTEAADGQQALERLDGVARFHLVVSDVNMPQMDGITLLTRMKQHPRHRFTPVIMLTTEGQEQRKELGRLAGARAWMTKPFDPPRLIDAVARLVA